MIRTDVKVSSDALGTGRFLETAAVGEMLKLGWMDKCCPVLWKVQ